MKSRTKGTRDETRRPKFKLPTSSLAILVKNPVLLGYFTAIIMKPIPSIKHMFAMFDPKTLPTEMPIVSGFQIANMATKSSGREVEKATNKNPIFVFPRPVTLAKLTELVIAKLLAFIKISNVTIRTATFPAIPSGSSTLHFLLLLINLCSS
ncbi:MAG TPA: hypothetical protein DGG95_13065 [Cytophagales bacterium]|nr:hypothetical protein [Cytophagales bacterium]